MQAALQTAAAHNKMPAEKYNAAGVERCSDEATTISPNFKTTPSITQNSRLFTLPPELRNYIYAYVLVSGEDIQLPASGKLAQPALLKACRMISSEAGGIYYSQNGFRAYIGGDLHNCDVWLQHLPLHAVSSITSFTLEHEPGTGRRRLNLDQVQFINSNRDPARTAEHDRQIGAFFHEELARWKRSVCSLKMLGLRSAVLHIDAPAEKPAPLPARGCTVEEFLLHQDVIAKWAWGGTMKRWLGVYVSGNEGQSSNEGQGGAI